MTKTINSKLKKVLVLILAFVMVLTYMPVQSFAATVNDFGTHAYFRKGSDLVGSDGKKFYHSKRAYTNRWYTDKWNEETMYALQSPRHSYALKSKKTGQTYKGYCLEQDVRNPDSGNVLYTASDIEDIQFLKHLGDGQVKGIHLCLLYGKQPDSSHSDMVKLLGSSVADCNMDDWFEATQRLIWEYQQNLRKSPDSIPSRSAIASGKTGAQSYKKTTYDFFYETIRHRPAGKVYRAMLNAMRDHKEVPSFVSDIKRKNRPKTLVMEKSDGVWKAVNTKYANKPEAEKATLRSNPDYYVLEDDNEINKDIRVLKKGSTNTDKNFKFEQAGDGKYTVTYTGDTLPDKNTVFEGKKDIKETTKMDCMAWNVTGSHYQTLAFGAKDPVSLYFKMSSKSVPAVTPGEGQEKPEIEVFPEFQFPVHKDDKNPGWDGDNCTGMGDAPLDSTFTLSRDTGSGWEVVDSTTLDIFGTTSNLIDKPWMMPEDIPSVDSGSLTHNDDEGNFHCTVTPTDCTWDASVSYKIEETGIPIGRFDETASGTGNGVRETYTVDYHAAVHNDQDCTDNPEKWGDITYTIDVTDSDGTVTTYTGTVQNGDIDVDLSHQFNEQIFVNDNFRGDLQIVKTKDDLDPFTDDAGIMPPSTDSFWTIQLKSGGYEDHPYIRVIDEGVAADTYGQFTHTYKVTRDTTGVPADTSNPLKVSKDGQIYVRDLCFGTYIVKEIKADSNGYVLEEYEVIIDEDGDKISCKANNKLKENKIKVIKTNAETGKQVRWDSERTAFRIRYMGNPDPEAGPVANQPNYGKLLPNDSSYTGDNRSTVFYANKNGEIKLPYAIQYGNYQIEELVVPEGYFVGKYNKDGLGSIADMGEVNIIDHKGQAVRPPKTFLENVYVRDANGNKVTAFDGKVKTTFNTYGFNVKEQDAHVDGDNYITYYAVVEMPNIPAKGKIEITKDGEALGGWKKIGGIWTAIWDKIRQNDTKFEIYAGEDILQSDGVIPVKAYDSADDKEVALEKTHRDHSDILAGAKEIWEKIFDTGETIRQTSGKDISKTNKTLTEYLIKAMNGATYTENFKVRDDAAKMTYYYDVTYGLNYSKGGFNYTDVHVKKKSVSDDYVASIATTTPVLKTGDLEVGFVTMNYEGGNMVRMNALPEEIAAGVEEDMITGQHSDYNLDDITATIVDPDEYKPQPVIDETTGLQKVDDEGNPVFTVPQAVVKPAGWTDYKTDAEGNAIEDAIMVKNGDEYQILIQDGEERRWIPCTEDKKFYLSYSQEYDFTTAQHFNCEDGFSFNWDEAVKMESDADHAADTATTIVTGYPSTTPSITESSIYTHETVTNTEGNNVTTFVGAPKDAAPYYFKTNDGIKTEMYLSGKLSHTRITVTQSQLFLFDRVLPLVRYNDDEINWLKTIDADHTHFEKIINESNYVKADYHEVSPENHEVYYTIDIVTDNTDETKGFSVIYPDTTKCVPLVTDAGKGGKLLFESIDDTMVFPIGKAVATITTNLKGIAESDLLPLGTYWVREVKSNEGHVNAGEWKKFVLEYKDQYTPLIWDAANYHNDAVSVLIDLEKLFETAFESKDYRPGDGAVFGIFAAEDIDAVTVTTQDIDKKKLPKDSLVEKLVVTNGHARTTVKLPLGKYYIKEIAAPEEYKLNGTKYYFDAIDVLTADEMRFHYKDIGIKGLFTQDGNRSAVMDFDVLDRHETEKVNIDGTEYSMDTPFVSEDGNVKVTVMDGRANVRVKVNDGKSSTVKFENGSTVKLSETDQTYTVVIMGKKPEILNKDSSLVPLSTENFTTTVVGDITTIKYSPKVAKTNWLSEVKFKYVKPQSIEPAVPGGWVPIMPANKEFNLTSPEGTSAVNASVDYEYGSAELTATTGTITSITVDGNAVTDLVSPVKLKRIVRTPADPTTNTPAREDINTTVAVINFADGVSFTCQMDKAGDFHMSASGQVDKDLTAESVLTVDGSSDLPKEVYLKNTTAKTYVRNNTNAGVLHIDIKAVKNDHLKIVKPIIPPTPVVPGTPYIKTTAIDSETNNHISFADKNVTIIDTVACSGLTAGKEYTLTGILMNKDTEKPVLVNGKEVKAEKTFTPESSAGAIDMEFKFDGSKLDGETLVVFEKLTSDDKEIAKHEDINDKNQTVRFPEIGTTAKDSDTDTHMSAADREVTIVDTVKYENLMINREYVLEGVLVDQKTGKPIIIDGEKVTAETRFTPEERDGEAEVRFTFDGRGLDGKKLVVFEKLFTEEVMVAEHCDKDDAGQTIEFPEEERKVPEKHEEVKPQKHYPKTGDESRLAFYFVIMVLSAAAVSAEVRKAHNRVKERRR